MSTSLELCLFCIFYTLYFTEVPPNHLKITMDPAQLANLSPSQKEEIMQTVQQQVALANMQELLQKVTDKCFKKCITSPGSSMGSSDQKCVAMCMDRWVLKRKI